MRCKYCNVELYGDSKICPLCHQKVTGEGEELKPPYYPPKKKHRPHIFMYKVNRIYIIIALIAFVVSIAVNYTVSTELLWCYLVGGVGAYGYILLRHTVQSHSGVGSKVFVQALSIFVLLLIVEAVFDGVGKEESFAYALPIIIGVSVTVQAVILAVLGRRDRSLYLSTLTLSVLGYIPIILFAAGVIEQYIPSLVTAVLCTLILVVTLVIGRQKIIKEIKKMFHN